MLSRFIQWKNSNPFQKKVIYFVLAFHFLLIIAALVSLPYRPNTVKSSLIISELTIESTPKPKLKKKIKQPTPERLYQLGQAFRLGLSIEDACRITGIDPWFVGQINEIVLAEEAIRGFGVNTPEALLQVKQRGFSDKRIAGLTGMTESAIKKERLAN